MANIKITCDSAGDLPGDLTRRYRIDVLPLSIQLGQELRRDRVDVDSQEAYAYTEKTGLLPKISPVSVEEYRQAFRTYTDQGLEVIHISLSGSISRCFQNAREAAEGLDSVHVIDSCSISTGTGQLALLAAELAGAEYLAGEIVSAVEDMKKHMELSFVLQSPEYLHRGGRLGGLAVLVDRLLKMKPEVFLRKGVFHWGKPIHGDMEGAILSYVRRVLGGRKDIQPDRIFVTYSTVPRTTLDKVKALLQQLQPFEEILEVPVGSVVSGRCGPGCLGLSYLTC